MTKSELPPEMSFGTPLETMTTEAEPSAIPPRLATLAAEVVRICVANGDADWIRGLLP